MYKIHFDIKRIERISDDDDDDDNDDDKGKSDDDIKKDASIDKIWQKS